MVVLQKKSSYYGNQSAIYKAKAHNALTTADAVQITVPLLVLNQLCSFQ